MADLTLSKGLLISFQNYLLSQLISILLHVTNINLIQFLIPLPKLIIKPNLSLMENQWKLNKYCKNLLNGGWDTLSRSNLGSKC